MYETTLAVFISARGIKIPLMRNIGNLTKVDSIIMREGSFVGGDDSNNPKDEKQNAASTVPVSKLTVIIWVPRTITPTNKTTPVTKRPNVNDAIMSPKMIPHNAMGVETNRSNVLILVSQGAITGPTAEVVKNRVMPNSPGSKKVVDSSLPMANATNKKEGSNNPKMMVGPFKK